MSINQSFQFYELFIRLFDTFYTHFLDSRISEYYQISSYSCLDENQSKLSISNVYFLSKRIHVFSIQCVAAFAVSAVASQWERTGKPFNPLLGETYELVR